MGSVSPGGRPAFDFLGGMTSFVALGSENEAVLVEAGVCQITGETNT